MKLLLIRSAVMMLATLIGAALGMWAADHIKWNPFAAKPKPEIKWGHYGLDSNGNGMQIIQIGPTGKDPSQYKVGDIINGTYLGDQTDGQAVTGSYQIAFGTEDLHTAGLDTAFGNKNLLKNTSKKP
jgi:hypothetical protein